MNFQRKGWSKISDRRTFHMGKMRSFESQRRKGIVGKRTAWAKMMK